MTFQIMWTLIVSLFCFSQIAKISAEEDMLREVVKFNEFFPEASGNIVGLQAVERRLIQHIKGLFFWTFVLFLPFFFI